MINKINKLTKTEFIKVFGNIFENSIWITEKLYEEKPFNDYKDLSFKFLNIFESANKKKQIIVLNEHPDLADKTKVGNLTSDSAEEQIGAGLDKCTVEEFNEFKNLNNEYKKKFSFPFIYAVKKKSKKVILENFRKRINNSLESEFDEAIKQVKEIAKLRLDQIKL
tara:strand:- start:1024 stop:1521 length:498 start_codon:yes stop_codon:yes gene_type:complete